MASSVPRIYVACLASYNNGVLFGEWIDAAQQPEALREAITRTLKKSPCPTAEEYVIHDYEGFDGLKLSEFESIDELSVLALAIESNGSVYAHYVGYVGRDNATQEDFVEKYQGAFKSVEDYAEQYLDDTGAFQGASDLCKNYFDYEKFAHDLVCGGDIFTIEAGGEVHVFNNY